MNKRNLGQAMLLIAVILIMLAGSSTLFGWFDRGISGAAIVIALILIGAGTFLSKQNDRNGG